MSEFLDAMQEAADILTGTGPASRIHHPAEIDVRASRRRLKPSQTAFSDRFGFSVDALYAREPALVQRTLQAAAA